VRSNTHNPLYLLSIFALLWNGNVNPHSFADFRVFIQRFVLYSLIAFHLSIIWCLVCPKMKFGKKKKKKNFFFSS
jgi:hypothetical protein